MRFIILIITLLFSASALAVAPANPGFEDDLTGWTYVDIGANPGTFFIVSAGDATEGSKFGSLSYSYFYGSGFCGWTEWGPGLQSSTFQAGAGEVLSVDWRNWGTDDAGIARGWLMNTDGDVQSGEFFDNHDFPIGYGANTGWMTDTVVVPEEGIYYLLFQVGSYDSTSGCLFGGKLDLDNIFSSNTPPDCSAAIADMDRLWPPNHKFRAVEIVGVTDPEDDELTFTINSVHQDEPVNIFGDGNSCPDADGIGTDTVLLRAERVGGEPGFEGDGRVYHVGFTATDEYGASCSGTVRVGVPHDKKDTPIDGGPLYDSIPVVCP